MVYVAWYLGIGIVFCGALLALAYRDNIEEDEDHGLILAICFTTIMVWPIALFAIARGRISQAEEEDGASGAD